ncbi:unnamed protein product [Camellia sinensis]
MLWCVRNFLRHYAIKEKKKTHLLAWDEFSEKKTWGGLGFQDFSCCPNKGGCFCVGDAISGLTLNTDELWKNRKCGFSSLKNLPYKGG